MSENNHPERELGPPKADFSAPPPYELNVTTTQQQAGIQPQQQQCASQATQLQDVQQTQLNIPQKYHQVKLPTYEEVQMEKSRNGELPPEFNVLHHGLHAPPLQTPPPNPLLANITDGLTSGVNRNIPQAPLTFIAIDASNAEQFTNAAGDNSLLGTDIMFVIAFMVAFLFNWIGFLMLTCFCHTIAARYGALSGFGLSLAKWTLIVKHSTDLASHANSWLWWLIMAFGFLICVRALIQYVSIKRTWRLLSASAQERLLFFY